MESKDKTRVDANKKMENSNVEIKYVNIGGKEVPVRYELCQRKVDIFGLHRKNKSGADATNRKPPMKKNPNFKTNRTNGNQNDGHRRYPLWDGPNTSIPSNDSNQSTDSRDSTTESVKSVSKTDRLIRRIESNDRLSKRSESIDKMVNKMKKEKEPIKMSNKFDKLLSSVTGDDSGVDHLMNSNPKKNKKKSNRKSNRNPSPSPVINKISDNNSENAMTAQNESTPQTTHPLDNHKSDQVIEANYKLNNSYLNNNNNSEDKLKLFDSSSPTMWDKPTNIRVFKNSIHHNDNRYLISEVTDDDDNKQVFESQQVIEDSNELDSSSTNSETADIAKPEPPEELSTAKVLKRKLTKKSDQYMNGGSALLQTINNLDDKRPVKDYQKPFVERKSESSVGKTVIISTAVVLFLVCYAAVILRVFCDCN